MACYCSSSPPWSVVFINHHQPTFTDREAPSRHYFLYWEKDRKYFVFNYLDMELDCGGGEGGGGVKWCISNVWKNIVEATERTRVSVNSAASVHRNVMNYY